MSRGAELHGELRADAAARAGDHNMSGHLMVGYR
jgi:hypothetical protein